MRIVTGLTLLVCGAGVALNAQDTRLEHFQCYPVLFAEPAVPAEAGQVSLYDQFNTPEENVRIERPLRFCNPARKIHRNQAFGVYDPEQHLTLYATYPLSGPARIVKLRNQFGLQELRLREPFALATPTDKNGEGMPENLDHFRCYAASGKAVNERVGLSDQFSLPVQGHVVLDPVAFCNPVMKVHTTPDGNTTTTPVKNPREHLTCYSMTRTPISSSVTPIQNQFGRQEIEVGFPDTLCVPSEKLGWQELPDVSVPVPGNPRLTAQPGP